jgi:hypothetical protein
MRSPSLTIPSFAARSDHGDAADPAAQQNAGDILNAGVRANGNDIRDHHIGSFHGTAPFSCQSHLAGR